MTTDAELPNFEKTPCPKCGADVDMISLSYREYRPPMSTICRTSCPPGQHMHHRCTECEYMWVTRAADDWAEHITRSSS